MKFCFIIMLSFTLFTCYKNINKTIMCTFYTLYDLKVFVINF